MIAGTTQKLVLGMALFATAATATTEPVCEVTPTPIKEGTELPDDSPIKIIEITEGTVKFSTNHEFEDYEKLCKISTHYDSRYGEECPLTENAGKGKVGEFEAVCKNGKVEIGVYVYEPTMHDSELDGVPLLCAQTKLLKTHEYLYEIPCGKPDEECKEPTCPYVEDISFDFSSSDDFAAWSFADETTTETYLKLDSGSPESATVIPNYEGTEGLTFKFGLYKISADDLAADQKFSIRAGPHYYDISSMLTSSSMSYFGRSIVTTTLGNGVTDPYLTVEVVLPVDFFNEVAEDTITLGFKVEGSGIFAVDNAEITLDCDNTKAPKWDDVPPQPNIPSGGGGDPHFQRWGQAHSSFHGECDLVMVHSDAFHNGAGFDLHARTTIQDYFSYIETAALRVAGVTIEFYKDHLFIGDKKMAPSALPFSFGDKYKYEITSVEQEGKNPLFHQYYKVDIDNKSSILFKFYKQYLTISLSGNAADFGESVGLLGDYATGDMVSRDGVIMNDFDAYGFEWQVNPSDPKLFRDERAPQLPFERCRMPTAARPSRRNLRADEALYEEAVKACAHVKGSDFDLCADDIMTTGDIGLAELW